MSAATNAVTGTARLVRLQLRTGWMGFALAVLVIVGLVAAVMGSVLDLYGTRQERAQYAATLGRSPATAAFNGRPYDLDRIGGIATYEVGFFGLLILPAIVVMLAIRTTRTQEDLGREDLISAMQVGRLGPLLSAVVVVTSTIAASAALIWAAVTAAGHDSSGTARYALALGAFLLTMAGLGFICAEVSQSARSATGLAFGGVGVLYLVRAVFDGKSWDLGWTTPMGWLALARPYAGDPPWWPYLALTGTSVALLGIAVALRSNRDLGAGLIAPRRGPDAGRLHGPFALAVHVTAGSAVGWTVGAVAWGVAAGLLAEEMRSLLEGNPALAEALLGQSDTPDAMMTYLAGVLIGQMAMALAVQAVARLAAEELSGRLGVVLSTRLPRTTWWSVALLVVAIELVVLLLMGAVGFGVGAVLTGSDLGVAQDALLSILSYVAPAVAVAGAGALLLGVSPRLPVVGWLAVLWATTVALLGPTLQLPNWARNLSPIELLGQIPVEEIAWNHWWLLLAGGLGAAVLAIQVLRRRDLVAG
ncbi:hypothetical protein K8W59_08530 [Nocardioides rotundus]|uniref:ABC transporter permease n=1 Tax=Nocardioides rotundus TaxID=1774216 RepID=UPI001CBF0AAD|nr:hypothetical protein [Nocardioides rotundus]UAL31469.1 hypothetical protein K8W59_08530 [Nocardioides rotundus]